MPADIRVSQVPTATDRPPYWGTVDQVLADLEATRDAGALAADLRERLGPATFRAA